LAVKTTAGESASGAVMRPRDDFYVLCVGRNSPVTHRTANETLSKLHPDYLVMRRICVFYYDALDAPAEAQTGSDEAEVIGGSGGDEDFPEGIDIFKGR